MADNISNPQDTLVINNKKASRYEIKLNEEYAFSDYRLKDGKAYFLHTEVPVSFRGQGIADKLIKYGLDDVVKQGLQIVAWCPFVAAYVKRHKEYQQYT